MDTIIKTSVIIPVYNTADFVKEAILAITHQTLEDIEIIAIDDGSTDNSLKIIREIAASDGRVKVYTQENRGLSETRNRGLEIARGEYVYFMDSDDLLDKSALFECYEKCQKDGLDFVFFDADTFGEPLMGLNENYYRTYLIKEEVQSGLSRLEYFFANSGYEPSACLNFIKRSYLEKIKLRFYPNILHEDELFTFLLYVYADRVGFLPKDYFKRRLRANSIMTSGFSKRNIDGYLIVLKELITLKKKKEEKRIGQVVDYRVKEILGGLLYNARSMKLADRQRLLKDCLRRFRHYASTWDILMLAFPIKQYFKGLGMLPKSLKKTI